MTSAYFYDILSKENGSKTLGDDYQTAIEAFTHDNADLFYVDISKISDIKIDDEVSNDINRIIDEYYEAYSGVYTKSKKMLKELVN